MDVLSGFVIISAGWIAMPDLHQMLRSTDLDFLQRIARAWHIELSAQSFQPAISELETGMNDKAALLEMIELLPETARPAWQFLLAHHGKESWAVFTREFGELRTFGLARRARENPDQSPISAVEMLWYRGLIGRAFLKLAKEPQEYAYIPDNLLSLLSLLQPDPIHSGALLPRPASEAESKHKLPASDAILDHATEVLSALRMNRPLESVELPQKTVYPRFLMALLTAAGLVTADSLPEPEKVKEFLSANRGDALLMLYSTWMPSKQINDLLMLPGLIFDGNWSNDPLQPRELLHSILSQLEAGPWWSLPGLLAQLKAQAPDFQRPAGDYDSWFIREEKTQKHLRGFENWEKVDGALIRYLLAGPLHWLGVLDIARAEKGSAPLAFRISALGKELIRGQAPRETANEKGSVTILNNGTLLLDRDIPRTLRYQLSRFCLPSTNDDTASKYRVSPESLAQAAQQGLHPTQLIQLLQQAKVKAIPQAFCDALDRWEKYGCEASVDSAILLRLEKPDLLPILQKTPRISRCFEEVLNPKTVIVKPGSVDALRQALAEMGLLAEIRLDKVV
jgi:hypothetical protein